MIQVSVAIMVAENAGEGSLINVANIETIPMPHDDIAGAMLQCDNAIERLAEDVTRRARDQARVWAETASRGG